VARAFALVSLLVTLAVVGYLYTQSAEETIEPSGGALVEDMAAGAAADATLVTARTGIEAFFASTGTYVGAPVPTGVTLVAPTASSYCVQTGAGAAVRHVTSPGDGTAQPGPC
jgi:Tfp pilus assembly protein PilE